MLTAIAFAAWNAIMLTGAAAEQIVPALVSNAVHWALFILAAVIAGRCLQWLSGFGIWTIDPTCLASSERPASPLTIRRLLSLTATVAVLVLAYRTWLSGLLQSEDGFLGSGSLGMGWAAAMSQTGSTTGFRRWRR
jgi:hypothetical protein